MRLNEFLEKCILMKERDLEFERNLSLVLRQYTVLNIYRFRCVLAHETHL